MTDAAYLGDDLARFGDAIAAIDDDGEAISYAELARRADALVEGMGAERRLILLEGGNTIGWLVAYVACLRGRRPVLITPQGNEAARALLEAQFGPGMRMLAGDGYVPQAIAGASPAAPHEELAILLSTSGSTGSTKCVRLSRANIAANAAAIAEYLGIEASHRGTVNLPTHYSYGLSIVNSHLHAGATMLLTGRSVLEREFWAFLRAHGATSFAGVPHVYDLLDRTDFVGNAPPTLRYFTQAGGRLPADTARRFAGLAEANGWRFFIMYGQTEATARIAFLPPELAASHPDAIGVAIPGGRLSLAAADGSEIAGEDVDGELVYHGPNVMMGYAVGRDDLALPAGPRRLPTGDIARRDRDGIFRITGRLSRFVKILGNRIGLDDVEKMLGAEGHATVVTGIDDQLLVVTRDAAAAPHMGALLEQRLKLPGGYLTIRTMDEFPTLASGKIDYAGLKASLTQAAAAGGSAGVDVERGVLAVFVRVFGEAARDEDQSFTSLGGDSLNYVLVSMGLERVIPSLPADWETTPIGTLISLAEDQAAHRSGATMESNVLLRALAVSAVVLGHSGAPGVAGGAGLLMLLVGYNLFRFRGAALLKGSPWASVWGYLQKLVVPYVLLNLVYMIWKQRIVIFGLTFTSNLAGPGVSPSLFPQWFIEVVVQCVLIVGLLLSVPPLRRAIARSPFPSLLALYAAAVAARFGLQAVLDTNALYNRVPWMHFPSILLAWLIVAARTERQKVIVSLFALLYSTAVYLSPEHAAFSRVFIGGAGALIILWIPRLPVPRPVRAAASVVAAAVFYIYLLHETFMYLPRTLLHSNSSAAKFAIGMAGPITLWWVVEQSGLKQRLFGRLAALRGYRGYLLSPIRSR